MVCKFMANTITRLRRLRKDEATRDLVSETNLFPHNLIMPYFVIAGKNKQEPIKSMPGINRLSLDNLVKDIEEIRRLGIKAVLLFGLAQKKDKVGSEAYAKSGLIQKAIKALKKEVKDIIVITDVCLCGYTSHGHCGILKVVDSLSLMVDGKQKKASHKLSTINYQPKIDNAATLRVLAKITLSHAQAGADFVAPSAMMDGQVKAIREALDKQVLQKTRILAYSVKYASNFYGPFREALDSQPQFGDRKTYQMDFRNSDEALREIEADIKEGADIVMVKPALAYLDIIRRAKDKFNLPLAAYNVSGEYAMVKAYCQGRDTEKKLVLEILTSIKRAGADLIITYHAKEAAKWLKQ